MDKWLWAARFFKTRSLAARACELGRIEYHGQRAKPAREVHAGDMIQITNDAGIFQVEVLQLSDTRGPAVVAQTLYRETDESRAARQRAAEERRAQPRIEPVFDSRPSKRNRRELDRFRGRV